MLAICECLELNIRLTTGKSQMQAQYGNFLEEKAALPGAGDTCTSRMGQAFGQGGRDTQVRQTSPELRNKHIGTRLNTIEGQEALLGEEGERLRKQTPLEHPLGC